MNKERLKRVLAFFISGLIIFVSLSVTSYATAALKEKPSFTPSPTSIPGDLSLSEAYDIIEKGISDVLAAHGLSESSVEASFYDMMYQKLITDECHLSYYSDGTGPHEFEGTYCLYSSPGVWNEDYLTYFVLTLSSSWLYYDVNTFLDYARARLAAEYSASTFKADDYVQKEPIIIKSDTMKDVVTDSNHLFFPKNTGGKMSFRTDTRWQNKYGAGQNEYNTMSLYESFNGFTAVGGDEMYLVFFYKTSDDVFYNAIQYHLTMSIDEDWYEDRDEVEYTYYNLQLEYWDMVEGSSDKRSVVPFVRAFSGASDSDLSDNTCNYFQFSWYSRKYLTLNYFGDYNGYINYYSSNTNARYFLPPSSAMYNPSMSQTMTFSANLFGVFDKSGVSDVGYVASTTPIETIYKIDTSKIPDNYYITIEGDTLYDYSITNPETGQSDTINNYITNNYTYVTNNPENPGGCGSGGNVSGNVTVGGSIDVGGSVGVDINVSVPDIHIDIDTGNGGGTGTGSDYSLPDTDVFNSYYDEALDESSDFRRFIQDFMSFLPPEIIMLLGIGLTFVILCRIFGR